MLEEKTSVEAEVPYVFQNDNMCLVAGCTVGTEGQLLNIVQQFEKDEDEGKNVDIWNVYVLHIYLLILLQVLCKWIAGIVDDEVEIVLRDNMAAQDWAKYDGGSSSSELVVQHREKALEVLYTSRQMKVAVEKGIQTKMFQQRSRLDEEIDELWHLMQRCKRINESVVQTVI